MLYPMVDYSALDLMLDPLELNEFVGPCAGEIQVAASRLTNMPSGATVELVGHPQDLTERFRGFGGQPNYGRLVRALPVRGRGNRGEQLHGAGVCTNRHTDQDGTPRRQITLMPSWLVSAGHSPTTYTVACLVHGLDIRWRWGSPLATRGWLLEAKKSEGHSQEGAPCSWVIASRAGGRRVSISDAERHMHDVLSCLSLGLGYQVSAGPILFLGRNGQPLNRIRLIAPSDQVDRALHFGWLHDSYPQEAIKAALDFAVEVLAQWRPADAAFGIAGAASYLVRASHAPVLDWQARDLIIALERLVKKHTGPAGGDIRLKLERLEVATGLGHVTAAEREWLRRFRNRLSHEGTLSEPGATSVRQLHQSVGWLRSFVLRHAMACLGWQHGQIRDFGSVPHKMRPVSGRKFAKPSYVPPA